MAGIGATSPLARTTAKDWFATPSRPLAAVVAKGSFVSPIEHPALHVTRIDRRFSFCSVNGAKAEAAVFP
jgi:hypothetical protein